MLRVLRLYPLVLGVLIACPCQCGGTTASAGANDPAPTERQAVYAVKQVSCHGCAEKIQKGLAKQPGVDQVAVDIEAGRVNVSYDGARTDAETIRQSIEKLRYPARLLTDGPSASGGHHAP